MNFYGNSQTPTATVFISLSRNAFNGWIYCDIVFCIKSFSALPIFFNVVPVFANAFPINEKHKIQRMQHILLSHYQLLTTAAFNDIS